MKKLLLVAMLALVAIANLACAPAPTPVLPTVAPKATGASSTGAVALTLTGAVDKEQKLTLAALKAMNVVKLNLEHPKSGKQEYEGVRLNALLDLAQVKPPATRLVFTAGDGFTAEVTLADARKCADCLVVFAANDTLTTAMPNMASSAWVKHLIKIEVK